MKWYVSCAVVIGLLGFLVAPVMAESVPHCAKFSAELKGGYAKVNEDRGSNPDHKGTMYGIAADYYLECWVAAELGYDRFPKVKYTAGDITGNDAIHLASVGRLPMGQVGLSGKIGLAQTRATVPAGLAVRQGKHKEMAFYAAFGLDGGLSNSLQWLVDVSAVTKRKDVAAKYALAAGIRFKT
jgi:hypothetical protein